MADYIVTGVIDPDATGVYNFISDYGGKDWFRRVDNAWNIWWDTDSLCWIISNTPGLLIVYWKRLSPDIIGLYSIGSGVEGNPFVSAGGIAILRNRMEKI